MTEKLPNCDSVPLAYDCESVVTMQTFSQLTESNVRELVLSSAKKTCMFDPIPTPLFVTCLGDMSRNARIGENGRNGK